MGLSVKATEALVRERKDAPPTDPDPSEHEAPASGGEEKTNHVRSIEDELRQKLATGVEIKLRGKDRGQIIVRFESNDDFMRLLEVLRK